ncbi:MAG: hypothetical protein AB7T08_05395, partial [Hyphomonadaceae bacterium]
LTERLGASGGFSHAEISQAISFSSLAGIAGAATAMILGRTIGIFLPLMVVGVGSALAIVGVAYGATPIIFAAAMTAFGFFWNFAPPYQLPIIAGADQAGNGMAWSILTLKVFMAAGPIVYGPIADSFGFRAASIVAAAAAILSTLLFLSVYLGAPKAPPKKPER